MSDVLDITERLQETAAALVRSRREVAAAPDDFAMFLNLESLEKRHERLLGEMVVAAEAVGQDVCTYKVVPDRRIKLAGLASVLGLYQSLVSVVYDALKYGPKAKATVHADVAEHTSFDFGYAFAGSAGFVFTVPNERNLFNDSTLDESLRVIREIAKAAGPSDILAFARRLGPAPIRVMYKWAVDHVQSAFNADIEWRRGHDVRDETRIRVFDFQRLQQTISATSDDEREEVTSTGTLLGADVSARTFHFRPDAGGDVRGTSGDVIDLAHSVVLPQRYTATILKTTKVLFSTEEEKSSYELIRLRKI